MAQHPRRQSSSRKMPVLGMTTVWGIRDVLGQELGPSERLFNNNDNNNNYNNNNQNNYLYCEITFNYFLFPRKV
jgi:hypothetical protein